MTLEESYLYVAGVLAGAWAPADVTPHLVNGVQSSITPEHLLAEYQASFAAHDWTVALEMPGGVVSSAVQGGSALQAQYSAWLYENPQRSRCDGDKLVALRVLQALAHALLSAPVGPNRNSIRPTDKFIEYLGASQAVNLYRINFWMVIHVGL